MHHSRLKIVAVAAGVLFWVGLLAMGCGSAGPEGESGASSPAAGDGKFQLDVEHCGGFGIPEAAAVLGVPAENLKDQSQKLSESSRWCIYANPSDPEKGVTFTVSQAESADAASEEFQQFRSHAGVAVGALGEKGQQAHEVAGLGDEALWTPVPGGVYLRKGRYSVQVNKPSDEETQIKIAHKILGE